MFTQAVYPDVELLCFSRMDSCLSSILAVLLSWGVPCKHLTGLPHVRSMALLEFTNYLQTYVLSFFIYSNNVYTASVSPSCVRQIMSYFVLRPL